uniref:ArsR/SmtB family transcription factor n=1 Tax=Maridesulfovibrio frigidus TaxID=340956 RepID=UPI000B22ABA3|nr:metalloregulator ArsR/SmtB family transcription factor [Maridesulfovibrio frigidus]
MAQKFKALSNPHRLRMFLTLASCMGTGCVHESDAEQFENCQRDFAKKLELAPSTVSHHFKELRNCGLVHMERQGKKVLFWVDAESVKEIRSLLGG